MSAPIVFTFQPHPVRIIIINDDPWFVASDISTALEYRDAANLIRMLEPDEKGTHNLSTPGGNQEVSIISQPGLFRALSNSRSPKAKPFQRWLFHDVLPTIYKTGRYEAPHAAPPPVYISSGQESQMSNRIWNLARPFYMEGSVKHWLYKYANALAGVHRRQFIPASQFQEVLAMLNSIEAQADAYRDERIRHEKDWLLLTLKRELDQRLGRAGPEFEMLATPSTELTA